MCQQRVSVDVSLTFVSECTGHEVQVADVVSVTCDVVDGVVRHVGTQREVESLQSRAVLHDRLHTQVLHTADLRQLQNTQLAKLKPVEQRAGDTGKWGARSWRHWEVGS